LARFTLDKAGSPRPFQIILQNFLQAWYPSKGFYTFTLYAIWPPIQLWCWQCAPYKCLYYYLYSANPTRPRSGSTIICE